MDPPDPQDVTDFPFRALRKVTSKYSPFTSKLVVLSLPAVFLIPKFSLNQILIFQVVTITLFGLMVIGGDNAFHVLTVKQMEEQDNCLKQVRKDPAMLRN